MTDIIREPVPPARDITPDVAGLPPELVDVVLHNGPGRTDYLIEQGRALAAKNHTFFARLIDQLNLKPDTNPNEAFVAGAVFLGAVLVSQTKNQLLESEFNFDTPHTVAPIE